MALDSDIELLQQVPSLGLLGRDALRILAISAESRTFNAGDVLFREGEPADAGYLMMSGAVALLSGHGAQERETLVVRRGALMGETALLVDTTWPGTATAIEHTNVMRIGRGVFLRMLEGEPRGAVRLRLHLAQRLSRSIDEIKALRPRFEIPEDAEDSAPADEHRERQPR